MQLAFVHADYRDWHACLQALETVPDPLKRPEAFPGAVLPGDDPATGDQPSLTPLGFMILGVRGLATAYLGQPEAGAQMIRPALAWAERTGYRVFHYLPRFFLAQALFQGGRLDEAWRENELVLEQARSAGNRWAVGVSLRLAAEIMARQPAVDWGQVENYLIESLNLLRQVRARPDLARTYLALRRLYDRVGQMAWAVDCHFRATSIFEDLGMNEELAQALGQQAGGERRRAAMPGVALRGPG
jgi:hypothetical protein